MKFKHTGIQKYSIQCIYMYSMKYNIIDIFYRKWFFILDNSCGNYLIHVAVFLYCSVFINF